MGIRFPSSQSRLGLSLTFAVSHEDDPCIGKRGDHSRGDGPGRGKDGEEEEGMRLIGPRKDVNSLSVLHGAEYCSPSWRGVCLGGGLVLLAARDDKEDNVGTPQCLQRGV